MIEILECLLNEARGTLPGRRPVFDPASPRGDEREFGRDKKGVQGHQGQDDSQARRDLPRADRLAFRRHGGDEDRTE